MYVCAHIYIFSALSVARYRWGRILHPTALADVNSFLLAMSTGSSLFNEVSVSLATDESQI